MSLSGMLQLGITDPTFKNVGSYGEPSMNIMNRSGGLDNDWSPLQQWEMWLHKPEPSVVSFDHVGLSDIIRGVIYALTDTQFSTTLLKLLGGENNGIRKDTNNVEHEPTEHTGT